MKSGMNPCIAIIGACMMLPAWLMSQTIITGGSHLIVTPGYYLVTVHDLTIHDGGNLIVNGTLKLKKNLLNQNVAADDLGSGLVEFSGQEAQQAGGQNIFEAIRVDNAAGILLNGSTQIRGVLTLTDGRIILGDHMLTMGPLATVAGTPNYKRMVVATGIGELRKEFGGPGSFTYPVGDADGTAEYTPVTVTFASGSFPSGHYIGVRLKNEKYPDPGITGNYLSRYWVLTQSPSGTPAFNALFKYMEADVVGSEEELSCTRVSSPTWSTWSPANTFAHQLSGTSISGAGSFTGVRTTTTPTSQELLNIEIGDGMTMCYDATQVLYVAGNGNTFLLTEGAGVTLVAGQKIILLPGTEVDNGCYLHGYISTNGIYCGSMLNPLVANPLKVDEGVQWPPAGDARFTRIYPNPTTSLFTVEVLNAGANSTVFIDICRMDGRLLERKVLYNSTTGLFSLSGMPVGIYLVHVRTDGRTHIGKIVKY